MAGPTQNGFESPTPGLANAGRLPTIIGQGAVAGRSGDDTAKWMAGPRRVSRSLPGEISTKGLEGRWLPFDRSGVIRQLDRGTAAARRLRGAIRLTQADLSVQIQSNFPFADSSLTMFQNLVCGPRGGGVRDRNYAYTWIARPFGVHRRVVGVCGGCDHSFKGASDERYAVAGSATLVARHRSGRSCWAPASATRHH